MTDLALSGLRHWTAAPRWTATDAHPERQLSVEVRGGSAAYEELRADWERLAGLQRSPFLFQTPDLLLAWARHFVTGPRSFLATVVVRQDNRPLLIWPLLVEETRLARIVRGAGAPIGQYDEILLHPHCDATEVLAAATEALVQEARPDILILERVRADGPLHWVLSAYEPLGEPEGAPYSDLSGGVAGLMGTLKSRVVRQQKKRVSRFQSEGEIGFEVAETGEQAANWLAEAIEMKREWLRSTGRVSRAFMQHATSDCLLELARTMAGPECSPRMLVARLALDGRTAAIEMGFRHGDSYHLYLGAYAPDLGRLGPGNVLTEKLMQWCTQNRILRYDMLPPRTRNKSEWQSAEVLVLDYALPVTRRGRFYNAAVLRRLRPAMRKAFYALPAAVRSTIAARVLSI